MDDEEDFEFVEFVEMTPPARRFHKVDLIVLGIDLIRGLSQAVTNTLTTTQDLAAMHANFQTQREDFHEQAALEIEMLVTGEDEK